MRKHILNICLPLLCTFMCNAALAQTLKWQPEKPLAGQKITFSYEAGGGDLEFSDEVSASLVLYQNFKWIAAKLQLKKSSGRWTGEYLLPENASFLAVKFYQGNAEHPEASDNNKNRGYYTAVLSSKGKNVQGNFLAEAILKTPGARERILNSYSTPDNNPTVTDSLLKKEFRISSSVDAYLITYLSLKKNTMNDAAFRSFAGKVFQDQLKRKEASEKILADINRYYAFNLKDTAEAKKVEQQIYQKFPNSETARFLRFQALGEQKDPTRYQAMAEKFLRDFPPSALKTGKDSKSFIYYSLYRGLGASYFDSQQYDKFIALFPDLDFKTANELYRWSITRGDISGKGDKKLYFNVSKKIISYILSRKNDGSYAEDFSSIEAAKENAENQLDDRLTTHISLANAVGEYQNANSYFPYLSGKGQYGNADLNAIHVNILEKLGDQKSVLPLIEASVKVNAVTPVMFDKLKQIYLASHQGSLSGYEEYLLSLTPADKRLEMRNHVISNMVRYPLEPFTLESADGSFVSSSDWKNKIIVIDFWATWCRPCIMAFPGMQLLVDQYAKDPTVGIYMIGTMQNGDYKTRSVNFVKSEGYHFNLLHDAIGPKGEQDKVFKSLVPLFNSSAIPRKIILKDGVVRYSSEGYSGSPSQLRDELSTAIEILKAEK